MTTVRRATPGDARRIAQIQVETWRAAYVGVMPQEILDGLDVELRHTPYAVDAAVTAIRTSGYPGADQIAGWLLQPENPDAVSAYFESVAT